VSLVRASSAVSCRSTVTRAASRVVCPRDRVVTRKPMCVQVVDYQPDGAGMRVVSANQLFEPLRPVAHRSVLCLDRVGGRCCSAVSMSSVAARVRIRSTVRTSTSSEGDDDVAVGGTRLALIRLRADKSSGNRADTRGTTRHRLSQEQALGVRQGDRIRLCDEVGLQVGDAPRLLPASAFRQSLRDGLPIESDC
jgi:hypothetical protein